MRMIVTNRNGSFRIPVSVPITTSDNLIIRRDDLEFTLGYTQSANTYYIDSSIDSSIYAGEWIYEVGDNLGIIRVSTDINDTSCLDSSNNIIEYQN